jgi:hypothetical protein
LGEPTLIATAPAIANALFDAIGIHKNEGITYDIREYSERTAQKAKEGRE